mmetsp:Transcript_9988/g.28688  ORF Transcript_9988/g.28688 Transcript_9988/m.28688 type:complete len:112 (+) Transcript_9988:76-411(+)
MRGGADGTESSSRRAQREKLHAERSVSKALQEGSELRAMEEHNKLQWESNEIARRLLELETLKAEMQYAPEEDIPGLLARLRELSAKPERSDPSATTAASTVEAVDDEEGT